MPERIRDRVRARRVRPARSRSAISARAAAPLGGREPVQPRDQLQRLDAAQVRIQERLVGQVADVALERDRVGVAVAAQDGGAPRARAQQAHQQADGRRLARAVRPQEPHHLARLDAQVQIVDRRLVAEPLAEADGLDHAGGVRRRRRRRSGRRAHPARAAAASAAPGGRAGSITASEPSAPRPQVRRARLACAPTSRPNSAFIASAGRALPSARTAILNVHPLGRPRPAQPSRRGRRRRPPPAATSGARR